MDAPAPSTPGESGSASPLAAGGALFLLAFVPFIPALAAGFVWDDYLVTDNPLLRLPGGLWKIWADPRALGDRDARYWPLLYSSFWIEYRLWGAEPFGYHFDNILLHALNAFLAWRILLRARVPGAWLGAALFAVHPVHVEAVAWVIERKGTLSTFFFLAAFLAFMRHDERPRRRLYALSLLCFVAAYLSKPVTVTLPAALLIWLWLSQERLSARDLLRVAPFFALAVAMFVGAIALAKEADPINFKLSLPERLVISGRAFWFYVGKLAWPSNLMAIYPRWVPSARATLDWLPFASAGALVVALWALRARIGKAPLAALLLYGIGLAPTLGVMPFGYMERSFVADRYQYLPSLAALAFAASIAIQAAHRLRRGTGVPARDSWLRLAPAAFALAILSALTATQSALYKNVGTLFGQNVAKNPRSAIAWHYVGDALLQNADPNGAIEHYRKALALDPRAALTRNNLGTALAAAGREDEALAEFLASEAINARNPENQANLGQYYERHKDPETAIRHYEAALAARPDLFQPHLRIASILETQGRADDALLRYEEAARLNPDSYEARTSAAVILATRNRPAEAAVHFAAAAALRPSDPVAQFNLGLSLFNLGHKEEAARAFDRALALKPDFAQAKAYRDKARAAH